MHDTEFSQSFVMKRSGDFAQKNYFKDSSPRHDLGFLLGLDNCASSRSSVLGPPQQKVTHASLQSKRLYVI